jgi:hypothetical protein
MAYAKSHGEFVESDDRGITVTLLKTADVLLAEARNLGKLLLRQAPPLSDSPNIPTDQSAHVHAQRSADYILEVYQLKYVSYSECPASARRRAARDRLPEERGRPARHLYHRSLITHLGQFDLCRGKVECLAMRPG